MIQVTDRIALDEAEITEQFVRSSGPGGQHVNKTSTAVELRFDVRNSPSLPEPVKQRLATLAGRRMNFAPEYECCRRLALENGVALKDVMAAASRAYLELPPEAPKARP